MAKVHWTPKPNRFFADATVSGELVNVDFMETRTGLPLGTRACEFSECVIDLPARSRLVLYSDGICEASNDAGEDYGVPRIQAHVSQPGASVHTLVDDVRRFTDHAPLADDATVVMIEAS